MSNLIATKIIDKNGKPTTVHKKLEDTGSADRVSSVGAPPAPAHESSVVGDVAIPKVGESVRLASYDFETSDIYEDAAYDEHTQSVRYAYSEAYDEFEERAGFLSAEDGIVAVATRVLSYDESMPYSYRIELTMFDGNKGYNREISVPFSTGERWESAPTVQDVLASMVSDIQASEGYDPRKPEDVIRFAEEFGYEPNDALLTPYMEARDVLMACKSSESKLRGLVGNARYGDYVYGRYKADHGYDSGINYTTT